jgi:hypothetical protein
MWDIQTINNVVYVPKALEATPNPNHVPNISKLNSVLGDFVASALTDPTNSKDQVLDQSAIYNSPDNEDSSETESNKAKGGRAGSNIVSSHLDV